MGKCPPHGGPACRTVGWGAPVEGAVQENKGPDKVGPLWAIKVKILEAIIISAEQIRKPKVRKYRGTCVAQVMISPLRS